jgi:hypothetical protein
LKWPTTSICLSGHCCVISFGTKFLRSYNPLAFLWSFSRR